MWGTLLLRAGGDPELSRVVEREERFISVLFNSPAALSFMHVTTLVTLYRQTVGLDASSKRETTSPKPAQEIA